MKILQGDVREVLKTFPSESVQTCVTSPPYWGLRDYGAEGQLGLERTPEEYVANMVEVFREVRRVLRDDGTLWLNLGDSYSTKNPVGRRDTTGDYLRKGRTTPEGSFNVYRGDSGLGDKQLIGIPWRVAFALQYDGWILRQDIIWHKTNPMPESAKDRFTRAHEFIFLFSKHKNYYFDTFSVREESAESSKKRSHIERRKSPKHEKADPTQTRTANMDVGNYGQGRNRRDVWTVGLKPFREAHFATYPPELIKPCILAGCPVGGTVLDPFNGSGTTGLVAMQNGREYIGIELNPEYIEISKRRLANVQTKLF